MLSRKKAKLLPSNPNAMGALQKIRFYYKDLLLMISFTITLMSGGLYNPERLRGLAMDR